MLILGENRYEYVSILPDISYIVLSDLRIVYAIQQASKQVQYVYALVVYEANQGYILGNIPHIFAILYILAYVSCTEWGTNRDRERDNRGVRSFPSLLILVL